MAEGEKIIFSMIGVSKKIERKEILRDISLSFFYGAKIGVLGLNGSGNAYTDNVSRLQALITAHTKLQAVQLAGTYGSSGGYDLGERRELLQWRDNR